MNSPFTLTHEEIARRAHALWDQRGRPEGQEVEHWLTAERELKREREQKPGRVRVSTSGPASVPLAMERARSSRTPNGKAAIKVLS